MLLWLAGCAAVILLRFPVLLHGRFWSEDGPVFYGNAWRLSWESALFAPYAGYVNVVANGAGLLAWALPLAWAPYGPLSVSLAVQLAACAVVVTAGDAWLARPGARIAALGLMLLVPFSEEVWLNGATAQFHLLLGAALILALEAPGGWGGWWRCAMLFLAPLAGPGPVALVPLGLVRLGKERSGARAAQMMALGAGLLVQLAFVLEAGAQDRLWRLTAPALACEIYVKNLLVPGAGFGALLALPDCGHGHLPLGAAAVTALVALIFAVVLLRAARREPAALWLAAAGLSVLVFSYGGALGGERFLVDPVRSARYAYAPQVLLAFSLLAAGGLAARAAVGWLLGVALVTAMLPKAPLFLTGPDWQAEVAAWRRDPSYALRIWPSPWQISLPGTPATGSLIPAK